MYKMGIAGEVVIGKEVGSSPGLSHSPPITILISFTVAGFRPLPSQVYVCMYVRTYVCMYVCMYACVCMYECVYVCMLRSICH